MKLSAKFGLLFSGLFAFSAAVAVAGILMDEREAAYGAAVNIAGRQRALSQAMAKEALLMASGLADAEASRRLSQAMADFEQALADLVGGNPERRLLAETDTATLQQLRASEAIWRPFREALRRLLASGPDSVAGRQALQLVAENSVRLLDASHQTVGLIETQGAARRSLTGVQQLQRALLAGNVVLVVVSWLVVHFLVAQPIRRVARAVEGVAGGDFTVRFHHQSGDEVGDSARALNRAAESLQRLIGTVKESAQQVAAASRELAQSSEQVGRAVQQVSETVNQMAQGAERQSSAATATAETARQSGEIAGQVMSAADGLAERAGQAGQLAAQGRQALATILQRMEQIRQAVDASGGAVRDLGARSGRIGQIVDLITGIADQTNLLALNAAIEAARAGEHGRGFAVVAEEVRKLAEQSRQAAGEIAQLVGEIRQEVERVVRHTESGFDAVNEGAQAVEASGQTFEGIARGVEEMVQQIQAVGSAARRMVEASQRAVRAVDEIAAITQQNAAGAEEVASTTEEQTAAVQEIASGAGRLAAMAQTLSRSVELFKT